MNEMYVISVLMLYTLIILINTLLNTYSLLTKTEMVEKKMIFYFFHVLTVLFFFLCEVNKTNVIL